MSVVSAWQHATCLGVYTLINVSECSCVTLQVLHQLIRVALYVSSVAVRHMKVELRFGLASGGTQCVMILGPLMMQELHAGSLGIKEQQLPIQVLILDREQGTSYWIIWLALELKDLFSCVRTMGCMSTTVDIVKMQV